MLASLPQDLNLGNICESFVTQTRKTAAIIKGVYGPHPPLNLGNKISLPEVNSIEGLDEIWR